LRIFHSYPEEKPLREDLLSVGIDIGTSTTQVVFSSIVIEDMSSGFSVPRIEIIDKQVIYRSDIYFTPLLSPVEINMAGVRDIVAAEYKKSGVDKAKIKTGAVIITGETARKHNASEVLHYLSEFAGDFVVAAAGPDLESIIAARGAGADVYSKERSLTAANYDIGGGTSNIAVFQYGNPIATGCLDIGGRLVKVDESSRKVTYIAEKISELCSASGISLKVGDTANQGVLEQVAQLMCELLEMSLGLRPKSAFYPRILTDPSKDLVLTAKPDALCYSGGVADYVYMDHQENDVYRYGDIGIILGRKIHASRVLSEIPRFTPSETIRATVVGAGSHITEVSGSTIEYDPALLPFKNIPVLKLTLDEEQTPDTMCDAIRKKLEWFRLENDLQQVAVAFRGPKSPTFGQVGELADGLIKGLEPILTKGCPLISVSENDLAKVLGQTVRARMPENRNYICIDSLNVPEGTYIDIGLPAAGGAVLPVIIKTLLFK